ncbi:MAG: hypothetical protein II957_07405 [Treponema sp.]|nr:hypothetical protein [Treponema sp.]
MDEVLLALPFILWLQSAAMPLRHPLSRVPLSLQPPHFVAVAGYASLPIGRMTQENPSLDFLGYCRSRGLLHVTKSRLHALFAYWQERIKHACKKIPPWLNIPWQETNPFPEPVEGNIQKNVFVKQ